MILFGVKKKYAELITDKKTGEKKKIVMGLELIRSNTPGAVKDFQRMIINKIFEDDSRNFYQERYMIESLNLNFYFDRSKILNEIFHLEKLSKNDVNTVETIFAETNAVIIAEHFSKNLISQAKASLKNIYPDLNKNQKEFFNEFSDFMYMREF